MYVYEILSLLYQYGDSENRCKIICTHQESSRLIVPDIVNTVTCTVQEVSVIQAYSICGAFSILLEDQLSLGRQGHQ